jgi:hypothetical protein
MLRALAFKVDTRSDKIRKITFTANSRLPREAIALLDPLVVQTIEARQSGDTEVADHLLWFAKTLERANLGTNTVTLHICRLHLRRLFGTSWFLIEEKMAEMSL